MLIVKFFFSLLFLNFFCLLLCFLILFIKRNKLIDTLNNNGYTDLADNLTSIYAPIKGTSVSEQKKSNYTWKEIRKIETNNIFIKRIQLLIKTKDFIRNFIISLVCVGILSGIIYLIRVIV